MINISEQEIKILNIMDGMNREETWQTMHKLMTVFTVRDIKETSYDKFLDEFKELALQQAKMFKHYIDKTTTHGHA